MDQFPLITLTTDFGLVDHYVASMKGVIFSRFPQARVVDISHQIAPFSIWEAAYTISQAAPTFPAGTVHVVVIDPGVGTARKPILVETGSGIFIAPDNGVLSLIIEGDKNALIREIVTLQPASSTFHGRDLFAPLAAQIASHEVTAFEVGPLVSETERFPGLQALQQKDGSWQGRILSVDRFGNLITNFSTSDFGKKSFRMLFKATTIKERRSTFARGEPGLLFVYSGSSGYEEIAANQRSASEMLDARPGDNILLTEHF